MKTANGGAAHETETKTDPPRQIARGMRARRETRPKTRPWRGARAAPEQTALPRPPARSARTYRMPTE